MGEARRRRGQLAREGAVGMRPAPNARHLSEQQRTAALVMYLFAVLLWDPSSDDDDERWTTHCMNKYASYSYSGLEACVWWALRYENSPSLRSGDGWIGYLEHVCSNHGVLGRQSRDDGATAPQAE